MCPSPPSAGSWCAWRNRWAAPCSPGPAAEPADAPGPRTGPPCRPHLDGLGATRAQERRGGNRPRGTVRLGAAAEFATARLLPALTPLTHHGLELAFTLDRAEPLLTLLAEDRLDLVVSSIRPPLTIRGLAAMPYVDEEFVLVGTPTRPGPSTPATSTTIRSPPSPISRWSPTPRNCPSSAGIGEASSAAGPNQVAVVVPDLPRGPDCGDRRRGHLRPSPLPGRTRPPQRLTGTAPPQPVHRSTPSTSSPAPAPSPRPSTTCERASSTTPPPGGPLPTPGRQPDNETVRMRAAAAPGRGPHGPSVHPGYGVFPPSQNIERR